MKESTIPSTPEDLLQELRRLLAEAEALTHDSLKPHAPEASPPLRERFDAARAYLNRLETTVRRNVTNGVRAANEEIHEHPYQALFAAAAIGLVAGLLLRRTSDK